MVKYHRAGVFPSWDGLPTCQADHEGVSLIIHPPRGHHLLEADTRQKATAVNMIRGNITASPWPLFAYPHAK